MMTEENKKTVISFIGGLLVGGLLMYVFANPVSTNAPTMEREDQSATTEVAPVDTSDTAEAEEEMLPPEVERSTPVAVSTGEAAITVDDQPAGTTVSFRDATFPMNEGWVGVRDYRNGQLTGLLGAARWNLADGLLPTSVRLLRATVPGATYAVVFYSENGDQNFSLATDAQLDVVMETFQAE